MTVQCNFCSHQITSLIVDRQLAMKEVTDLILEHMKRQHHNELFQHKVNGQRAFLMMGVHMMYNDLVTIPDGEEWLQEMIDQNEDGMMKVLGFDPDIDGGYTNDPDEVEEEEQLAPEEPTNVVEMKLAKDPSTNEII